jgi:hypothetical protein
MFLLAKWLEDKLVQASGEFSQRRELLFICAQKPRISFVSMTTDT